MSSPQSYLGSMKNRELVRDWLVDSLAGSESITKGMATYIDTTNGRKKTSAVISAINVRVAEVDAKNSSTTKGDAKITTVKSGAIICMKADGAIPVDSDIQSSTNGDIKALAPLVANADVATVRAWVLARLGRYIGKPGEVDEVNKDLSAAADEDEVFVILY